MKTTVKKLGQQRGGADSRVDDGMQLHLDDIVEVREEKGRIVIEPVRGKTYKLEDLLKGINSKNLHEMIDFGPPVGNEVW